MSDAHHQAREDSTIRDGKREVAQLLVERTVREACLREATSLVGKGFRTALEVSRGLMGCGGSHFRRRRTSDGVIVASVCVCV